MTEDEGNESKSLQQWALVRRSRMRNPRVPDIVTLRVELKPTQVKDLPDEEFRHLVTIEAFAVTRLDKQAIESLTQRLDAVDNRLEPSFLLNVRSHVRA